MVVVDRTSHSFLFRGFDPMQSTLINSIERKCPIWASWILSWSVHHILLHSVVYRFGYPIVQGVLLSTMLLFRKIFPICVIRCNWRKRRSRDQPPLLYPICNRPQVGISIDSSFLPFPSRAPQTVTNTVPPPPPSSLLPVDHRHFSLLPHSPPRSVQSQCSDSPSFRHLCYIDALPRFLYYLLPIYWKKKTTPYCL